MFGQEQSTLAVVLFCMLMSIRFVDFGYRVKQGIIGLGLVLSLKVLSLLYNQLKRRKLRQNNC
ncbi:MAG: hypothetical protein WBO96_06735 [Enterococcus aquimarinus]